MKALIFLSFIGTIIALGILIGRGNPGSTAPSPSQTASTIAEEPSPSSTNASSPSPTGQGGGAPTGTIVAIGQTVDGSEIQLIDVVTKQKKTLFTDKNQPQKIQLTSPLTRNSNSVLVLLSEPGDPAGELIAIATDGSGSKTTLQKNFTSTNPPVLSPAKDRLALTSFSNAEPNFGFTLFLMNLDGSNKKELARDEAGITRLAFSPDGKQLAFIKGAEATSNEIATVTTDSKLVKTLYSVKDKIITDFDWGSIGLLTITAAPNDKKAASQSEVFLVDPKTKSLTQVTKNSLPERTPLIAPDGSGIAFIQAKDNKPQNLNKPGDVIVVYPDGSRPVTLGAAMTLLGWVK